MADGSKEPKEYQTPDNEQQVQEVNKILENLERNFCRLPYSFKEQGPWRVVTIGDTKLCVDKQYDGVAMVVSVKEHGQKRKTYRLVDGGGVYKEDKMSKRAIINNNALIKKFNDLFNKVQNPSIQSVLNTLTELLQFYQGSYETTDLFEKVQFNKGQYVLLRGYPNGNDTIRIYDKKGYPFKQYVLMTNNNIKKADRLSNVTYIPNTALNFATFKTQFDNIFETGKRTSIEYISKQKSAEVNIQDLLQYYLYNWEKLGVTAAGGDIVCIGKDFKFKYNNNQRRDASAETFWVDYRGYRIIVAQDKCWLESDDSELKNIDSENCFKFLQELHIQTQEKYCKSHNRQLKTHDFIPNAITAVISGLTVYMLLSIFNNNDKISGKSGQQSQQTTRTEITAKPGQQSKQLTPDTLTLMIVKANKGKRGM